MGNAGTEVEDDCIKQYVMQAMGSQRLYGYIFDVQ